MSVELHSEQVPPEHPTPDTNGLGLAAFIISLVGLFSAGLLSLLAVIFGAIAMRRQPRGFAIAGFVIGLVGSVAGCLVAAMIIGIASAAGIGMTAAILSVIHEQIKFGIDKLDDASLAITSWSASHDGHLPSTDQGMAVLNQAGINGTYTLMSNDEYELRVIIDEKSSNPWTFTGTYESDGDRESLTWENKSGSSHGTLNLKSSPRSNDDD